MNYVCDISMTISDLLFATGISTDTAKTSAKIIETAMRESIYNDKQDDVHINESTLVLEKHILRQLIEKCNFTKEDIAKIQQIIQVCFKNYYFHEKGYTMKVCIFI